MTIVFETTAPNGFHRAYTGAKGILLPFSDQANKVEELYPGLFSEATTPMDKLDLLTNLSETVQRTWHAGGMAGDLLAEELVEEVIHFSCLSGSTYAFIFFLMNQAVRWDLTSAWRERSISDPPRAASLRVLHYFERALDYWRSAYPCIEGYFLARRPADSRLSSDRPNWHPLARETVLLVKSHRDFLLDSSPPTIGRLCDSCFVLRASPTDLLKVRDESTASANFLMAMELLSSMLNPGLVRAALKHAGVAVRSIPSLLRTVVRMNTAATGGKQIRVPMLLVGNQTLDPAFLQINLDIHHGLDQPLAPEAKTHMDFWWALLRTASETRALATLQFTPDVIMRFLQQRIRVYRHWAGFTTFEETPATALIKASLVNVSNSVYSSVKGNRASSFVQVLKAVRAEYEYTIASKHFQDQVVGDGGSATGAARLLNCFYMQL